MCSNKEKEGYILHNFPSLFASETHKEKHPRITLGCQSKTNRKLYLNQKPSRFLLRSD